jgi:hypothetical protein
MGTCFAANTPAQYLSQLSSSDFYTRLYIFTSVLFQPDAATATVVSNLLAQIAATFTSASDLQTFYVAAGSLVIFTNTTITNRLSTVKMKFPIKQIVK